jgi:hypothetical protein
MQIFRQQRKERGSDERMSKHKYYKCTECQQVFDIVGSLDEYFYSEDFPFACCSNRTNLEQITPHEFEIIVRDRHITMLEKRVNDLTERLSRPNCNPSQFLNVIRQSTKENRELKEIVVGINQDAELYCQSGFLQIIERSSEGKRVFEGIPLRVDESIIGWYAKR